VVVGGSLGGLTAALVLRDSGAAVDVYERSPVPLSDVGAGIVLHPATVRYAQEQCHRDIEEISVDARWVRYLGRDGAIAHEHPCRYRFTSYYTLYRILREALGPAHYHLGWEMTGFDSGGDRVVVRFAGSRSVLCDLLVCADGVDSTARRLLLPQVSPHYAGYVGWRGTVVEADDPQALALLRDAISYFVMPQSHILAYPIPSLRGARSGAQRPMNWVWYRNVRAGAELEELMTDRHGTLHAVSLGPGELQERHEQELRETARSCLPPPAVAMVRSTVGPFLQAVFDVEVPRMAFGRICLIGDAAFALRPHVAAGTAKAAEDAWKLAEAFRACEGDVLASLERWEPGQLELGRVVLGRAREAGDRFQFESSWRIGEPLPLGLYRTGDSALG
jgi:2,6-dihydroxypyridine 3-monooxygenase